MVRMLVKKPLLRYFNGVNHSLASLHWNLKQTHFFFRAKFFKAWWHSSDCQRWKRRSHSTRLTWNQNIAWFIWEGCERSDCDRGFPPGDLSCVNASATNQDIVSEFSILLNWTSVGNYSSIFQFETLTGRIFNSKVVWQKCDVVNSSWHCNF